METIDTMIDLVRKEGLRPNAYEHIWRERTGAGLAGLDKEERKKLFFGRYNYERMERIQALYTPSEGIVHQMAEIDTPQVWMVLTEDWCVDSALVLPVIKSLASLSNFIDLRLLPRDDYPEVMDRYLTNGGRSIPKLIAWNEAGEEMFQWGPRAAGAVALRQELLESGADKQTILNALIDWYERGGWIEVEREIVNLLYATTSTPIGSEKR